MSKLSSHYESPEAIMNRYYRDIESALIAAWDGLSSRYSDEDIKTRLRARFLETLEYVEGLGKE